MKIKTPTCRLLLLNSINENENEREKKLKKNITVWEKPEHRILFLLLTHKKKRKQKLVGT